MSEALYRELTDVIEKLMKSPSVPTSVKEKER